MAQAKIASKNDPSTRQKARVFIFNEKVVKPVLFIGENVRFMAAAYEDGSMVENAEGDAPMSWSDVEA